MATPKCALTQEQVESLYAAVVGKVAVDMKNGVKHNPEVFMKELFNMLKERSSEANALDYIQHIPKMLNIVQASSEELGDYMMDSGVSVDRLNKLRRDFKDLETLKKFIAGDTNDEALAAQELIEEVLPSKGVIDGEAYDEFEAIDKKKKQTFIQKTNGFQAQPETGLSTLNQEAQTYDGLDAKQNVPDPDVKKQTYYKVVRAINNLLSKFNMQNADKLKMGNTTGIFLKAVKASDLKFDDLYTADQKNIKAASFNAVTIAQNQEKYGIFLVYSDKDGNILYFDKDGNISSKEDGGTLAYSKFRKVLKNVQGNKDISYVQDVSVLAQKPGAADVETLQKARDLEIEIIGAASSYLIRNPKSNVLFSVRQGRNGYVEENFNNLNLIGSLVLDNGFAPYISPIENESLIKGGVYFDVAGYDMPVLVQRPKFSQINNLAENLAAVLFDSKMSNEEKIDILKQFVHSKDTTIYEKDGNLVVRQGDQILDVNDKANKQSFIDVLQTITVNINKDLIGTTYKNPVMENGKITTETKQYNNFLSNNFYTSLQKNEENKIVRLNAYNTFSPTAATSKMLFEVAEKPAEEKPSTEFKAEQATPTDNPMDVLRERLKQAGRLKKEKGLSSEATDEQIAQAERWYNNSPLSKYVPFENLMNIINSDAQAEFTLAGITLFTGSNFTDLYHEGWHVFSQLFLTKEQKKKLYSEMRNLSGSFTNVKGKKVEFKNASDIELEEFAAEDFRKYVLSGGKTIIENRSARNNIFKKIYNFLKALFKGQSFKSIMADRQAVGLLNDLYDKLYIGDVNEYKPSLNNVQFNLLNKGIQSLDATSEENKGLTYQDSMVLVQSIDSLVASTIANTKDEETGMNFSMGAIFTDPSLMGVIYDTVKYQMSELRKNFPEGSNPRRLLDFAIDNWGDYDKVSKGEEENGVIAFHKLRSSYLTFEDKFSELSPLEEDIISENTENADKEESEIANSEADLREKFGQKVGEKRGNEHSVMELASNEIVYLIKSLPAIDKKTGKPELNILGVPKLVDFGRTWGIVINTVAGSINKTDMYNKLVQASNVHPELKALVDRLKDPNETIQDVNSFSYYHMWTKFFRDFSVYRIPITEVQVIRSVDKDGKTQGFQVRYVESDPLFEQVKRTFKNDFETSRENKYITRDASGANVLNLGAIVTAEKFQKTNLFKGNNAFDFLKAIGLNLTDNAAVKKEIITKHKTAVDYLHDAILKLDEKGVNVKDPILALTPTQGGRLREIFLVEAKYSGKYSNNAINNVEGNNEYDLSLNNSITQVTKELNDLSKDYKQIVEQPHMAHLNVETNPFAKYSWTLDSLFDLPVFYKETNALNINKRKNIGTVESVEHPTLNIVNLNGVKAIDESESGQQDAIGGIKTTSLDINSKFLQDLHSMLESGVQELTRRASKSSAYGAKVTKLTTPHNAKSRHLYIGIDHFLNLDKPPIAAIADLLFGKIAAEMERIAIVKSGAVDNILNFKERGSKFTIFDDILSDQLQEDLIKAADAKDSYSVVTSATFKQRITDDLNNYFYNKDKGYIKEVTELFNEMPYLSRTLRMTISKLAGKNSNITDRQAEQIAVQAFTVNSLIHNMEMLAIFDGDLAMYNHLKEEYHKRNASVTSTGRIFSADLSDFRFINQLGRAYASSIKAPKKDFDGQLTSAVFKDNEIPSVYHAEYLEALTKKFGAEKAKAILKPYEKMNEGDAQGWITFDSYRILSLLEGNWSPKQNELYHKIINEEKVSPEDLAEYFPPRKYQYAGPIKSDKLHIQAFHKFSLAPLIPSVIKGTNMETLHNNMVKQGLDYGLFESGSKMATVTDKKGELPSLYTDSKSRTVTPWNEGDAQYPKNVTFIQYLKNQVDINSKWKKKTIFSTQLRKLIVNDLFRQGLSLDTIEGSEKFDALVEELEKTLNDLQGFKKQELLKEIGWTTNEKGESQGDLRKLLDFVRKELTRQDLSDHAISFIELNQAQNAIKNDLSYSMEAEKIEKLLNSIVVKRLVRQKLNGEQLVQLSGAGFETANRGVFSKASEEQIKKYRGTNDLPTYRPGKGKNGATSAMKVKIAMKGDYYKLLELNSVKDFAQKNNITPLQALNSLLKSDEWLDKDDNRKLVTMVGVRIPVQGFNSMEFMEVYEFLPEEAGNILIPPAEIVAKSGSDFDIDKLTIFQPNYSSSKKYASYSNKENTKGTENKVIELIRRILEHPDNFDALIRPNETDLVKGVADDLAKENIQGYNHLDTKVNPQRTATIKGKETNVISPTRALEIRYNLYKHESNNIGKKTLGIGAVDNSYSSIFKRIGAYLQNSYTYRTAQGKEHPRKIEIRMAHNTLIKDGVSYISLSNVETQTFDKISDLISQLMNGWVDIEKDAWIFNINGNNTAGPVMLFLLEAGVDFRTAAYFVSQPIIVDYIKRLSRANSPFYEASGLGVNQGKGLNKSTIRRQMLGFDTRFSAAKLYKAGLSELRDVNFDKDNLLANIKNPTSDFQRKILMHFIELEDVMRDLTKIKLTLNVDTSPSKSFFSAQSKLSDIQGLDNTDIFNPELINKIKTKSPISSFFTQQFQLRVFEPIMKLRANKKINDHLISLIRDREHEKVMEDPEKYVAAFKNDLPLYLLQNYIKRINLNKMTEYNSLRISTQKIPIEIANLEIGAFVADGVMYVDQQQMIDDFKSKAYTGGESYKRLGLKTLPADTFQSTSSENVNLQEYMHYVLEREYLRSIVPVSNLNREQYEAKISEMALYRTFNFNTLLKSPLSVANQFSDFKKNYPSIAENYLIFDQLIPVVDRLDKKMKTLKFRTSKLDKEMTNILHENLVRLSDLATIKSEDPNVNRNMSNFFSRFIIAEYLRSGLAKTSDSLAQILPTDTLMKLVEEPMKIMEEKGFTDEMLKRYTKAFNENWTSPKRNKFRSYIENNESLEYASKEETQKEKYQIVQQNNVNLFKAPTVKSEIAALIQANPNYRFVYGGNQLGENDVLPDAYASNGNSFMIPIKKGRGDSKVLTDETYEENVANINKALDALQENAEKSQIAFPAEGITSVTTSKGAVKELLKTNAPRTFEHLAKELHSRFDYVHPGAEELLGFRSARDVAQRGQKITDLQVDEFIKKCFS